MAVEYPQTNPKEGAPGVLRRKQEERRRRLEQETPESEPVKEVKVAEEAGVVLVEQVTSDQVED